MKKAIVLIVIITMLATSLTTFAQSPDTSPNITEKPATQSKSTSVTQNATVPVNVKPVKSYTAVAGKAYKLPDAAKKTGDSYVTSNSKVLTVDKSTGRFTAVSNGTAYIVVTNGTDKSYIKITVGTGTTATDTTTKTKSAGAGVLSGYNVTVNDKTTPAVTSYGKMANGKYIYYFASGNGTVLGSISGDDQRKIAQAGVDSGTMPTETKDMVVWFANQFNLYRGVEQTNKQASLPDFSSYASSLEDYINDKRSEDGIHKLTYDPTISSFADVRANELSENNSHIRPNGRTVADDGYAEIIYGGQARSTPSEAYKKFFNSTGHRDIMLSQRYNNFAASCYQALNGNIYWVVLFSE